MKLLTVMGPPSAGKTSVLLHLTRMLRACASLRSGLLKFGDHHDEEAACFRQGMPLLTGLSAGTGRGDCCLSALDEALQWAESTGLDLLAIESCGSDERCNVLTAPTVFVADCLASAPSSCILPNGAALVAVTKGDLVSRAARETFIGELRKRNPRANVVSVNGVTGQGTASLLRQLRFLEIDTP